MKVDGYLYCQGETNVNDSVTLLNEVIDKISSIKIPNDFDNNIYSIKDNLYSILDEINNCVDLINRVKLELLRINKGFYSKYFSFLNTDDKLLTTMSENNKIIFMDYLMKLIQSGVELDQNTKDVLMAFFGDYTRINYSGEFSKFTDYQNINMTYLSNVFVALENNKDFIEGKTIKDLLNTDQYKNDEYLNKLYKRGFGDIRIVEINRGYLGFSAIILQDKTGNYMINYNCTETDSIGKNGDYLYDTLLALNSKGISTLSTNTILEVQRKQAQGVAKKYIDESNKNNVKLNISGYSLGGSLSEEALIYCDKNGKECLGKVTIFNPIHNSLTKKEVEIIKSYKDQYQCYASQGDSVSAFSNYDDLKDVTRYIGYNYKENYKEVVESFKNGRAKLLDIVVGSTHSAKTVIDENKIINNNFDENGNYNSNAEPVPLSECLKTIMEVYCE